MAAAVPPPLQQQATRLPGAMQLEAEVAGMELRLKQLKQRHAAREAARTGAPKPAADGEGESPAVEKQKRIVMELVARVMLHPRTFLPIDVGSLDKKMQHGPMSAQYGRATSVEGMPSLAHIVREMAGAALPLLEIEPSERGGGVSIVRAHAVPLAGLLGKDPRELLPPGGPPPPGGPGGPPGFGPPMGGGGPPMGGPPMGGPGPGGRGPPFRPPGAIMGPGRPPHGGGMMPGGPHGGPHGMGGGGGPPHGGGGMMGGGGPHGGGGMRMGGGRPPGPGMMGGGGGMPPGRPMGGGM